MTRPSRPTPPSAIDGFRRLERTRSVTTGTAPIDGVSAVVDAQAVTARRPRRSLGRRIGSSLRLVSFVAALVAIVGTSVSLAGSNGTRRDVAKRESAAVAGTSTSSTSAKSSVDSPSTPAAKADDAAVADATGIETIPTPKTAAAAVVPATTTAVTAPARSLPLTGVIDTTRLLLAGSLLVLLGMLAQIAGTPLPARVAH
jgi:hypothetical protein